MSEFEPDWKKLDLQHVGRGGDVEAIVTELRRQEREAGWVLVQREDVAAILNTLDDDGWVAASAKLEVVLAATEQKP